MKINYFPETDSLYIELSQEDGAQSVEISDGVVLDYDSNGKLSGIDIDNATHKVELKEFFLKGIPSDIRGIAA